MVTCVVSFKIDFDLHLRERKHVDLYALFNHVNDLMRNMKASRIQLKTRQYHLERGYFQDKRTGKDSKTSLAT